MRVIAAEFRRDRILLRYVRKFMTSRQSAIYVGSKSCRSNMELFLCLVYALARVGYSCMSLKPEQKECIKCIFDGKDVFVWLPTGLRKVHLLRGFTVHV